MWIVKICPTKKEFVKAVLSPLSCGPAEGQHLMWRHFLPVTSHLFYLHTCHSRQQSPDMVQYAHIRLIYLHTCHSGQQNPDMVQYTHLSSVIPAHLSQQTAESRYGPVRSHSSLIPAYLPQQSAESRYGPEHSPLICYICTPVTADSRVQIWSSTLTFIS